MENIFKLSSPHRSSYPDTLTPLSASFTLRKALPIFKQPLLLLQSFSSLESTTDSKQSQTGHTNQLLILADSRSPNPPQLALFAQTLPLSFQSLPCNTNSIFLLFALNKYSPFISSFLCSPNKFFVKSAVSRRKWDETAATGVGRARRGVGEGIQIQ